jgi:hypothetical protein
MPFLGTRGAGTNKAFGFSVFAKPNQVTGLTATDFGTSRAYNNGRIDLSWTAPANNGATITGYFIERSTNGSSYSTLVANTASGSTTYSDTSLTSAQIYYYKVSAINAAGTGDASTAANATATTVPQAPTIGTATGGNASATVTYTANATGGKAVSTFTATSSPGSLTGTGTSPITVSGLTNGTAYTFTVTATNANGTSTASAASNSVTPIAPYALSQTFNTSGTFTVPSGKTFIALVGTSAGGGGGGSRVQYLSTFSASGSGGGSGSVFILRDIATNAGTTYTVTIGSGGTGGTSSSTNGNAGGTTSFGNILTANGGGAGLASTTYPFNTVQAGGAKGNLSFNTGTLDAQSNTGAGGNAIEGIFTQNDYTALAGGTGQSVSTLNSNAAGISAYSAGGGGGGGQQGVYNGGNSGAITGTTTNTAGGAFGGRGGYNGNVPNSHFGGNNIVAPSAGTLGGGGGGLAAKFEFLQGGEPSLKVPGNDAGAGGTGQILVYVK